MAGDVFGALLEEERKLQQRIAEVSVYIPSVPYDHVGELDELDKRLKLLKAKDRTWLVMKGFSPAGLPFVSFRSAKGALGHHRSRTRTSLMRSCTK